MSNTGTRFGRSSSRVVTSYNNFGPTTAPWDSAIDRLSEHHRRLLPEYATWLKARRLGEDPPEFLQDIHKASRKEVMKNVEAQRAAERGSIDRRISSSTSMTIAPTIDTALVSSTMAVVQLGLKNPLSRVHETFTGAEHHRKRSVQNSLATVPQADHSLPLQYTSPEPSTSTTQAQRAIVVMDLTGDTDTASEVVEHIPATSSNRRRDRSISVVGGPGKAPKTTDTRSVAGLLPVLLASAPSRSSVAPSLPAPTMPIATEDPAQNSWKMELKRRYDPESLLRERLQSAKRLKLTQSNKVEQKDEETSKGTGKGKGKGIERAKERDSSTSGISKGNGKAPARPKSPRKPRKKPVSQREAKARQTASSTFVDPFLSASRKPDSQAMARTKISTGPAAMTPPVPAKPFKATNSARAISAVVKSPRSARENVPVISEPQPTSPSMRAVKSKAAGYVSPKATRASPRKKNAPQLAVATQTRAVTPTKPRSIIATGTDTLPPVLRRSPRKPAPVRPVVPLAKALAAAHRTRLPIPALAMATTSRASSVTAVSSVTLPNAGTTYTGTLALPGEDEDLPLLPENLDLLVASRPKVIKKVPYAPQRVRSPTPEDDPGCEVDIDELTNEINAVLEEDNDSEDEDDLSVKPVIVVQPDLAEAVEKDDEDHDSLFGDESSDDEPGKDEDDTLIQASTATEPEPTDVVQEDRNNYDPLFGEKSNNSDSDSDSDSESESSEDSD